MAIKILMADDHFVVRQGVRQMIGLFPDLEVVGEAGSGEELIGKLQTIHADLVMTDMTMPGLCGADLIARLRTDFPNLPILVLSMHNDVQIAFRALRAGANGYITKDSEPSVLANAIRKVASGKRYVMPELAEEMVFVTLSDKGSLLSVLSPREREILDMFVAGESMVDIAEQLHVSAKTISTHKMRLMQKLNVTTNAELILLANAEGVGKEGRGL